MGWFSESEQERSERVAKERAEKKRILKAEKAAERHKKWKKSRSDFQKKIDEEVEKNLIEQSPEAKQARLEKMFGSSSLLNAALGLEFAMKGDKQATPWMDITKDLLKNVKPLGAQVSLDESKAENTKQDATAPQASAPKLNRGGMF